MTNFTAFLSYVLVANFAPGPNTIISMSNSGIYGFKKSLKFNLGIFCGVFIIFTISNIFSVVIYDFIPSLKSIMSFVGAAYILFLAWQTYKSKPNGDDITEKHANTFLSGLLLQFVNPSVIIYALATVSTFIIPYYQSTFILVCFSIILSFVGFIGTCSWALFGSIFQKFIIKNYKVINTAMALLLVFCSISLFI